MIVDKILIFKGLNWLDGRISKVLLLIREGKDFACVSAIRWNSYRSFALWRVLRTTIARLWWHTVHVYSVTALRSLVSNRSYCLSICLLWTVNNGCKGAFAVNSRTIILWYYLWSVDIILTVTKFVSEICCCHLVTRLIEDGSLFRATRSFCHGGTRLVSNELIDEVW